MPRKSKLYKLTDEKGQTYNNTQWAVGVTHEGTGEGELCGPGWIHAYTSPLLAVLLNPIHADFKNPRLWEAEGVIVKNERGLKVGCQSLTLVKEIGLPKISLDQKVRFAILCALVVCQEKRFHEWAKAWIDGKDKTAYTAYAVKAAAYAADAVYAAYAVKAAAYAADAAYAAYAVKAAAYAADAAYAAVYAVKAAAYAAEAAAYAADAANMGKKINLKSIAKKATREEEK